MHPSMCPLCISIKVLVSFAAAIKQIISMAVLAAFPYLPTRISLSYFDKYRCSVLITVSSKSKLSVCNLFPCIVAQLDFLSIK